MKRKSLLPVILLGFIFLTGCTEKEVQYKVPEGNSNFAKTTSYGDYPTQEKNLINFLEQKMLTKQGVYTNYKKQSFVKSEARGHELLSESSGLWLEYLVYSKQYQKFREFYAATKETFDQGSQFSYRYTPAQKKKFPVNATLDDLRIIRALQMYADATKSSKYQNEAAKRFAMLKKNTMSNGKIASFYDVKAKASSAEGALAYYDFSTLKYFETNTAAGKKLYQKQLAVVKNGYLGDAFPIYASSYNWQTRNYSNADLNTSEALETLLHLSEIGQLKKVSLSWLEYQVNQNTLYNTYSTNGSIVDKDHSAGSYALAAMIFADQHDKKMYQKAMDLVWKYQVTDKQSPIYGGIGINKQTEAYSYNNLTTLLAARY